MSQPPFPQRRSIRLSGFDYSQSAAYFVTLVTHHREMLLGSIAEGQFQPTELGRIVDDAWLWLACQYPYIELGEYCVMPNHLHGILFMVTESGQRKNDIQMQKIKPLGQLIGAYKTVSTKQINQFRKTPEAVFWQRNYYERIIRNEKELEDISVYIQNNPVQWELDQENPNRQMPGQIK